MKEQDLPNGRWGLVFKLLLVLWTTLGPMFVASQVWMFTQIIQQGRAQAATQVKLDVLMATVIGGGGPT